MEENKTCAIIGATPETLSFGYDEEHYSAVAMKVAITEAILELIQRGFTDFISSLEQGAEMWGAEACSGAIRLGSQIRLICVPTSEEQANRWHPSVRERYFRLLEACTEPLRCRSEDYILENADAILVAGSDFCARTAALIAEASRRGIELIRICCKC